MGPLVSHTILKAYLERRNLKQRKERNRKKCKTEEGEETHE
jgi:hypothetical protein